MISFTEANISFFKMFWSQSGYNKVLVLSGWVRTFLPATCGCLGQVIVKQFPSSGSTGFFHLSILTWILVSFQSFRLNVPVCGKYYQSVLWWAGFPDHWKVIDEWCWKRSRSPRPGCCVPWGLVIQCVVWGTAASPESLLEMQYFKK